MQAIRRIDWAVWNLLSPVTIIVSPLQGSNYLCWIVLGLTPPSYRMSPFQGLLSCAFISWGSRHQAIGCRPSRALGFIAANEGLHNAAHCCEPSIYYNALWVPLSQEIPDHAGNATHPLRSGMTVQGQFSILKQLCVLCFILWLEKESCSSLTSRHLRSIKVMRYIIRAISVPPPPCKSLKSVQSVKVWNLCHSLCTNTSKKQLTSKTPETILTLVILSIEMNIRTSLSLLACYSDPVFVCT